MTGRAGAWKYWRRQWLLLPPCLPRSTCVPRGRRRAPASKRDEGIGCGCVESGGEVTITCVIQARSRSRGPPPVELSQPSRRRRLLEKALRGSLEDLSRHQIPCNRRRVGRPGDVCGHLTRSWTGGGLHPGPYLSPKPVPSSAGCGDVSAQSLPVSKNAADLRPELLLNNRKSKSFTRTSTFPNNFTFP